MSTPEFDIFKRIEDLEGITLELMDKTQVTEPTLKSLAASITEINKLSNVMCLWIFMLTVHDDLSITRRSKDSAIGFLRRHGVEAERVELIEQTLNKFSDWAENYVQKKKLANRDD